MYKRNLLKVFAVKLCLLQNTFQNFGRTHPVLEGGQVKSTLILKQKKSASHFGRTLFFNIYTRKLSDRCRPAKCHWIHEWIMTSYIFYGSVYTFELLYVFLKSM